MQCTLQLGMDFILAMLLNLEDSSFCNYVNVVWTHCDANVMGSKVVF
jgi:hypothetical protein